MANHIPSTRSLACQSRQRQAVQLRETLRRQHQRRLRTEYQPEVPWALLAWGLGTSLALWLVATAIILPVVSGVLPLLQG